MDADQGGRPKAQEADRIGNLSFPAGFDQRLIEGDVGASATQSGFNHAERLSWRTDHIHALAFPLRTTGSRGISATMPASICRRTVRISLRFSLNG